MLAGQIQPLLHLEVSFACFLFTNPSPLPGLGFAFATSIACAENKDGNPSVCVPITWCWRTEGGQFCETTKVLAVSTSQNSVDYIQNILLIIWPPDGGTSKKRPPYAARSGIQSRRCSISPQFLNPSIVD